MAGRRSSMQTLLRGHSSRGATRSFQSWQTSSPWRLSRQCISSAPWVSRISQSGTSTAARRRLAVAVSVSRKSRDAENSMPDSLIDGHALRRVAHLTIQRRVDDRLCGDLCQPDDDLLVRERLHAAIVENDETDHVRMAHERDAEQRAIPPLLGVPPVHLRRLRVRQDVEVEQRLLLLGRFGEVGEVGAGKLSPSGLWSPVAAERDEELDLVAVQAVDVAHVGLGHRQDAGGDRAQHVAHFEGGAELETGVHQRAQLAVALFQTVEQVSLHEGAAQQLADVAGEIEILGEVALADIADIEGAHELAFRQERHREAALGAPFRELGDLGGRQTRVVEAGDHHRLAGLQRFPDRRALVQVDDLAGDVLVAFQARAGHAAPAFTFGPPDVATGGVHEGVQTLRGRPLEFLRGRVSGPPSRPARPTRAARGHAARDRRAA